MFPENEAQRDDVNRLGFFYEMLRHYLYLGTDDYKFAAVLLGAVEAEHEAHSVGRYPPQGHDYARLD